MYFKEEKERGVEKHAVQGICCQSFLNMVFRILFVIQHDPRIIHKNI